MIRNVSNTISRQTVRRETKFRPRMRLARGRREAYPSRHRNLTNYPRVAPTRRLKRPRTSKSRQSPRATTRQHGHARVASRSDSQSRTSWSTVAHARNIRNEAHGSGSGLGPHELPRRRAGSAPTENRSGRTYRMRTASPAATRAACSTDIRTTHRTTAALVGGGANPEGLHAPSTGPTRGTS